MARLDARLWGDRQEIDLKHDWSNLTEAERVRKAMQMLDMAEELVNRGPVIDLEPRRIEYDPTDGDELADAERRKRLEQQEAEDDDAPIAAGGIGR
jgi:hypothetical protein